MSALRSELQALRALLEQLEQRLSVLEEGTVYEVVDSPSPVQSFTGFSPAARSPGASITPPRASALPGRGLRESPPPAVFRDGSSETNPGPPTSEFRVRVAEDVGHFLARALRGGARGPSGRDRLSLASKIYIICRDAAGLTFPEPLVTSSFTRVKELCLAGAEVTRVSPCLLVCLLRRRSGWLFRQLMSLAQC